MSKLIAKKIIYYKGKRYIPGEEIPANDMKIVEAWKRAESVVVEDAKQEIDDKSKDNVIKKVPAQKGKK